MNLFETMKFVEGLRVKVEKTLEKDGISIASWDARDILDALGRGRAKDNTRTIDALTWHIPAEATLEFTSLREAALVFARCASSAWAFQMVALGDLLSKEGDDLDFQRLISLEVQAYENACKRSFEDDGPLDPARTCIEGGSLVWRSGQPPVNHLDGQIVGPYPTSETRLFMENGTWKVSFFGTAAAVHSRLRDAK